MKLLVLVKEPQALVSGVIASTPENQDAVWRESKNVCFCENGVQVLGGYKTIDTAPAEIFSIATAEVDEVPVYYLGAEDGVYFYSEDRIDFPNILQNVGSGWHIGYSVLGNPIARRWDLLTWGTHLIVTDGEHAPQYWSGDPDVESEDIVEAETKFGWTKIIKKLKNHILAYNNNLGEDRVDWSQVSDPMTWEVTEENSAGGITIRDLEGAIQAATNLQDAVVFFGSEQMGVTRWIGGNDVFSNTIVADGVGALGKDSVVGVGRLAYGVGRHGFWRTDGFEVQNIGDPAINRWFRDRAELDTLGRGYCFAFHDSRKSHVFWFFLDDTDGELVRGVGFNTTNGSWSQHELGLSAGASGGVLNWPIVADGAVFAHFGRGFQEGETGALETSLRTGLFAIGTADKRKLWDKIQLELTELSGAPKIRVGYTDEPTFESLDWTEELDLETEVWLGDRESIFLCFEILTSQTTDYYRLGGFSLWGEVTGSRA